MHLARRRSAPRRPTLLVAATVTFIILAVVAPSPGRPADAQVPGFTLTATPTEQAIDGQAVDVRVEAAPGISILRGGARICRDGPAYAAPAELIPLVAGNCPNAGVSSSATAGGQANLYPTSDGSSAIGSLRVGVGTVEWGPETDSRAFTLTCDESHPCRLVVDVQLSPGGTVIDSSTLMTFVDGAGLGSCGGTADGALSTSGPDRMIETWAELTRSQCDDSGTQASTIALFTGEGLGADGFAAGTADLTYSALGPNVGPGHTPDPARPSVSVPFALNAAVIGVLGGYQSEDDPGWPAQFPRPFSDLEVTMGEMATLFGEGQYGFGPRHFDAIMARNPQLAAFQNLFHPEAGQTAPLAPAQSDATSYLATRAFTTREPELWKTPPVAFEGTEPDVPRGVDDELSAADPGFPTAVVELYSQRANVKQEAASLSLIAPNAFGVIWVLTDLATATQLDIPTVALENDRGEFVSPTASSLAAAVPTMERQDDGTFEPAATGDAPGAYPLAFVEHAVAPAAPLADLDCSPRESSQALLTDWLGYLTGAGQAQLDGLVPLTPALKTAADESLAEVGQGDDAACGPDAGEVPEPPAQAPTPPGGALTPPGAPGVPPGGDFGLPSSGLGGSGLGGSGLGGSGLGGFDDSELGLGFGDVGGGSGAGAGLDATIGDPVAQSPTEDSRDEASESADQAGPSLPALLGISSLRGPVGVGAVLGLAIMGSVAGMLTSGRTSRPRTSS